MKVLYLTGATGADYMADVAFHGLRSLLGPDCVDVNKMWYMYDNSPDYMFHSLYKLLPDIEVDRTDIQSKINSHYFDAIIYGSVHRYLDYQEHVRAAYPRNRIVFIDGEDGPELTGAVGAGWYFKRELYEPHPDVLPIQFGIPKEKIRPIDLSRKVNLMAPCDPRDRSTYQYYDSETRYYDQYSDAYFGYSTRKGGWDCMRHHEIIASGTLPYFQGFDTCPSGTIASYSRECLSKARNLHDNWNGINSIPEWHELMLWMKRDLYNTETVATLVLDRIS